MLDYLRLLYSYDQWANREVLTSLSVTPNPPQRSLKVLAHILAVELLWFSRIRQQASPLPVWPGLTIEECQQQIAGVEENWRNYFRDLSPEALSGPVAYRNSQAESWVNSVRDILMHVLMHSAYHRGQIASDLRAGGYIPAYTDLIHALRQHLVE